jgi:peptidoglycan hydrolase-like protein with peptidoglycan-binding domain
MDTLSYSHLASVYEASENIDFIPIKVNLKFWRSHKLSSSAAIRLLSVALTISILGIAGEALAVQQVGSKGTEVANIQRCLKRLGFFNGPVNGNFASITRSAVIGFQRANRLTADGVVGAGTQRALQRACRTTTSTSNTSGELRLGIRSTAVSRLQQNLQRLGFFNAPITGYFGSETQQAVIRFQRANRIATTGIVGNQTSQAIRNAVRNAVNGVGGEYQVISEGSTGPAVTRLQQRLRQLGYFNANPTGKFLGITRDAVMAFQRSAGLPITGVVNIATWNALDNVSTPGRPNLSTQQIRDLQQRLQDLGYFNGNPTGTIGAMTRDAIVRFQRNYGLPADGVADTQILQAVTQAWEDRYANQPTRDYLTVGDRGNNVRAVQQRLSQLGFFTGSVDGYYDDWTREAVVGFQQYYQLSPTGNVDWQTWNALSINDSSSIRDVSNNTINNRYIVVVPISNGSTLNQVRRYVPDAYTAKSNLGTFVNAGSFSDRAAAEECYALMVWMREYSIFNS